jgi:hypothetical protein
MKNHLKQKIILPLKKKFFFFFYYIFLIFFFNKEVLNLHHEIRQAEKVIDPGYLNCSYYFLFFSRTVRSYTPSKKAGDVDNEAKRYYHASQF